MSTLTAIRSCSIFPRQLCFQACLPQISPDTIKELTFHTVPVTACHQAHKEDTNRWKKKKKPINDLRLYEAVGIRRWLLPAHCHGKAVWVAPYSKWKTKGAFPQTGSSLLRLAVNRLDCLTPFCEGHRLQLTSWQHSRTSRTTLRTSAGAQVSSPCHTAWRSSWTSAPAPWICRGGGPVHAPPPQGASLAAQGHQSWLFVGP